MATREQWPASWPQALCEELLAAYAEPHRHYHTLQHLDECFAWLDTLQPLAEHPEEVRIALWFHDAIYDPKRGDNEQRSADWARSILLESYPEAADRVHALVIATRHDAVPSGRDEEVVVDIDLSILGAAPQRFDEYERQVREEYAWVPELLFRRKRREVLAGFLARPAIYATAPMRARLEAQARANLERSLRRGAS